MPSIDVYYKGKDKGHRCLCAIVGMAKKVFSQQLTFEHRW